MIESEVIERPSRVATPPPSPRFVPRERGEFAGTVRRRVQEYFRQQSLCQKDNGQVARKAVVMIAWYVIPFVLWLVLPANPAISVLLAVVMGMGTAGIGMGVMHDALHGSFSKKSVENERLGWSMYLIGGSPLMWRQQHNVQHHTYTNILEHDEDIRERVVLRLSAQAKWYSWHRYQHLYAWALYPLMTFSLISKDFWQIGHYARTGILAKQNTTYSREMTKLVLSKSLYLAALIGTPVVLGAHSLGAAVMFFILMHLTCGMVLSVIFQMAHIVEGADHPAPTADNIIENEWMIHQLETTANFCRGSRWLTWYTGGLNHQIEHHLFPQVSHVHYPALSMIVEQTAKEFGLIYNDTPTFGGIMASHVRMLRELGRRPVVKAASVAA